MYIYVRATPTRGNGGGENQINGGSSAVPTSTTPSSSLIPSPDGSGLNSGVIIGVTLASLVGFVLLVTLLDILLLSNRLQNIFRGTTLGLSSPSRDEKSLPPLVRETSIARKPIPPPEVPFYNKKIQHSRSLSLDSSGYSSWYLWSRWGRSEDKMEQDIHPLLRSSVTRNSMDSYSVYPVFDADDDEENRWMEEKRATYRGGIKFGMGVQKRYTGGSFAFVWKGDEESAVPTETAPTMTLKKNRMGPTWFLQDPLERWRRGLHPLSGKRGAEFSRIGYYG